MKIIYSHVFEFTQFRVHLKYYHSNIFRGNNLTLAFNCEIYILIYILDCSLTKRKKHNNTKLFSILIMLKYKLDFQEN